MTAALASTRNLLKVWFLLVILCAVFAGVGWLLGGLRLALIFVFCALLAALAVYAYADRALMGMVGAREYALAENPVLASTVGRLAAQFRVVPPRLYVIADGFPRALSAGRGPRSASLAVSTGLLGALPPAELEGVLAHELAHIRSRDVLVQTFAVMLGVTLVEASRIGGWLERVLLFVLAPIAAAFAHLLLSPRREFAADRAAAQACGTPHGLADALLRLDQAIELVDFAASPATEPLYTIDPFADDELSRMFKTHPPVSERIARLRSLDPDWRARLHAA
jgi:heat shock protein HtpX